MLTIFTASVISTTYVVERLLKPPHVSSVYNNFITLLNEPNIVTVHLD